MAKLKSATDPCVSVHQSLYQHAEVMKAHVIISTHQSTNMLKIFEDSVR